MNVLGSSKVLALATAVGAVLVFGATAGRPPAMAQPSGTAADAVANATSAPAQPAKHRIRKRAAEPEKPQPAPTFADNSRAEPGTVDMRPEPDRSGAVAVRTRKRKAAPPMFAAQQAKKPVLTRPTFTEEEQQAAEVPGFAGVRFWASSAQDYARVVPQTPGPWLVLSSGGEDGAYGAGFLNGWTAAGNRPEFPVITGISTGALMAVWAFAGPKYDELMRSSYTSISAADIFELSTTPESLVDTWPLKKLIDKNVTPEVLADVAEQHKRGRRLFVLTTNLDAGRGVVWDMGAIATKGGDQALDLFRGILQASSAIPGEFPPVLIEVEANGRKFQEMHVDGGVNGPMYIAPESYLFPGTNRRLPMSQLYVILNGKVTTEFSPPQRTLATILGRSIWLALQMGARVDLALFYQAARRDGIDFNLALVDSNFDNKSRGAFDPAYMKALYERGFDLGKRNQFLKELPFRASTAVSEGSGGAASPSK